MAGHRGRNFDAVMKVNHVLKLKMTNGAIISVDTPAIQAQSATPKKLMVVVNDSGVNWLEEGRIWPAVWWRRRRSNYMAGERLPSRCRNNEASALTNAPHSHHATSTS